METSKHKDYDDKQPTCRERLGKQLRKRFPIISWLSSYSKSDLIADVIAGTTVGLTVVPQSMAYAAIAGLSPEYGLYSAYIGSFLYVILGSCKQVTIGPTAVMGLLLYETCGNDFAQCAVLTGFYAGVFELLMAVLQLEWVVSFISESVVIGFTAGASTTIISSQIKNFLGISGPKGSGFMGYWKAVFRDIHTISVGDCCIGITSFIVLFFLRQLKDYKHPKTPQKKLIEKTCWLISVSRNVIIVLATSFIAFLWQDPPFKLTGHVHAGFPSVGIPTFGLPLNSNITSVEGSMTYWETWSFIGAGPLTVALIAILQNVAISKAFGSGQTIDATQEMFALGTANVVGSFFSSIAISGSFSRSAVNGSSGVRSPMGGLFTGTLVLLSIGFLTPSFYYIPKASLAAVIISAVMYMIEYEAIPVMWRVNKMDAVACLVTIICSITLGMEYGIMIGVITSISVILIKMLRPQLQVDIFMDEVTNSKYLHLKPDAGINFPSVDYVRTSITKMSKKHEDINVIVMNLERLNTFDYTSATAITSLAKLFNREGKMAIFVNLSKEWEDALRQTGLEEVLTCPSHDLLDYIRKLNMFDSLVSCDSPHDNLNGVVLKLKMDNENENDIDNDVKNGVGTNDKMGRTTAGSTNEVVTPLLRK